MKRYFLLIAGLLLFINSFSQNQANDSIEMKLVKCLDDSLSTAGMCNCTIQAMNSWDKVLNKNYNLLMKSLNQSNKEFLKNAQKEWIIYRDKEFELINKIYYSELQGTLYYPMAWSRKSEIVKKRALVHVWCEPATGLALVSESLCDKSQVQVGRRGDFSL